MLVLDWLTEKIQDFRALPDEDTTAILDFTLAWSFFEANILNNNANTIKIREVVESWQISNDGAQLADLEEHINYFADRYLRGENAINRFEHLNFRPNDGKKFVEDNLPNPEARATDRIIALLIVIYRLRNNLFHGEKWAYGIHGQCDNFTHSTKALLTLLNTHLRQD